MTKITVLHENSAWVEPLRHAFEEQNLPYDEWFLDEGRIALDQAPPEGVFYNRMSASSHTRGHRYGPELTHGILNWLELHGRRVVNGTRALYLEISKLAQYTALQKTGILVPRTVAAVGRDNVLETARQFGEFPLILKPNRGGKGLGVQLFHSLEALAAYLDGPGAGEEAPIDGIWLIQAYIQAPAPYITRAEFIGGQFHYAVQVDTSDGFLLCPADACNIADTVCPAEPANTAKFRVLTDFLDDLDNQKLIDDLERFLTVNAVEIAGIEFIRDAENRAFTYDINTNTNYNAQAESDAGVVTSGMSAVAHFLGTELYAPASRRTPAVAAE